MEELFDPRIIIKSNDELTLLSEVFSINFAPERTDTAQCAVVVTTEGPPLDRQSSGLVSASYDDCPSAASGGRVDVEVREE